MSATVLGCGHTSHLRLFTIDVMTTLPHIHLHFMTGEDEYEELGYGKVELCCHGCGASTLVYYTDSDKPDRRVQLRDEFSKKHAKCKNRGYEHSCPDWRSTFKVIDIRQKIIKWDEPVTTIKRRRYPKRQEFQPAPRPPPRTRKVPENT